MLRIEHFTKSYGKGKPAVEDLNLHVHPGDIFAFIGPNGAGKTTTLRAVAGIHDFEGGDIFVNGVSIKQDPLSCKKVMRYIPDNPDLYGYLTGIQYLNFLSDIYGLDAATRQARIEKYADAFGITARLNDMVGAFSHGMKQKLALIGALIDEPRLLTHVLEVAEKLCNKVAIINHGQLVAQGDMDTVKGDDSLEELFMELVEKE